MNYGILIRCAVAMLCGWIMGFLMTRSAFKEKHKNSGCNLEGVLKIAYDIDDPDHPKMGLEIDSLNYILTHDSILLEIKKIGFPKSKGPIYLESSRASLNRKDKSA